MAKEIGKNHELALQLWKMGIRETQILASVIDEPDLVTEDQMEEWVKEFDNWEVCDQVCQNLFIYTRFAYKKAIEWSRREKGGFALMACLASKDKKRDDAMFEEFLTVIERESTDDRNYVKKAVNWALRQIGKRNPNLNKKAIELAKEIQRKGSKTAKWIARDAMKELTSEKVQRKLKFEEAKGKSLLSE